MEPETTALPLPDPVRFVLKFRNGDQLSGQMRPLILQQLIADIASSRRCAPGYPYRRGSAGDDDALLFLFPGDVLYVG